MYDNIHSNKINSQSLEQTVHGFNLKEWVPGYGIYELQRSLGFSDSTFKFYFSAIYHPTSIIVLALTAHYAYHHIQNFF